MCVCEKMYGACVRPSGRVCTEPFRIDIRSRFDVAGVCCVFVRTPLSRHKPVHFNSLVPTRQGQNYIAAMSAAANYAWVNRSSMTFLTRQAFAKVFNLSPEDLDMHLIYDVSHNIAKVEQHMVDGQNMELLVHRKGSTRAFPPHHPLIPVDYQLTGQPVIVGTWGHVWLLDLQH